MPNPVFYSISRNTFLLANSELDRLRNKETPPGVYLTNYLATHNISITDKTTPLEYLSYLMGTRLPLIFAETKVIGNGRDWTQNELRLLSKVAVNFTNTVAYNDGKWGGDKDWTNYQTPMPVQMACVSGTLLRNGQGQVALDANELVLQNSTLNFDALVAHYEQKLLPILLAHNAVARKNGEQLVVNLPGIGTGQFVTPALRPQLKEMLPRAISTILQKHAAQLTNIHTVNYDPFDTMGLDHMSMDDDIPRGTSPRDGQIHFQIRPFKGIGQGVAQLQFPNNITPEMVQQQKLKLLKIVAWDPCSFVMNDMWGDNRTTDEATAASTSILSESIKSGHLRVKTNINFGIQYDPTQGCERAYREDAYLSHSQLANDAQLETYCHPDDFIIVDTVNHALEEKAVAQNAPADAAQRAAVEAQQRATAEAQQRAAVDAQQRAAAEAQQRATAEAQQRAAVEAQQRAAADAQQRAAAEAQQRATVEAQQRAAYQEQNDRDTLLIDFNKIQKQIFDSLRHVKPSDPLYKPFNDFTNSIHEARNRFYRTFNRQTAVEQFKSDCIKAIATAQETELGAQPMLYHLLNLLYNLVIGFGTLGIVHALNNTWFFTPCQTSLSQQMNELENEVKLIPSL